MNDTYLTVLGILIPFFGTALGAGAVFILRSSPGERIRKILYGFAAGVMLASLVWSLLIPSLEMSKTPIPALVGFLFGMGFFILCERLSLAIKPLSRLSGKQKMIFAVTLHNLPEGMAVGIAFAGALTDPALSVGSAFVLAFGIALQNFPEGTIVSMPLSAAGISKKKAFFWGVLSGIVEPLGAVAALVLTRFVAVLLPYVLSFAAGAMLFVVADELIPALSVGRGKNRGLCALAFGFSIMMLMDVIFG